MFVGSIPVLGVFQYMSTAPLFIHSFGLKNTKKNLHDLVSVSFLPQMEEKSIPKL